MKMRSLRFLLFTMTVGFLTAFGPEKDMIQSSNEPLPDISATDRNPLELGGVAGTPPGGGAAAKRRGGYSSPRLQDNDTLSRGDYFSKKHYTDAPIPTFAEHRAELPVPVLDDAPEYVEMYWRAWELAFAHFKKPPHNSPFVSNYIDEAFAPQIFQWDTIFMIMFSRYAFPIFPTVQSLDNFYVRQHRSGYICREIFEADGRDFYYEGVANTVNPPLFAWAELEAARLSGDTARLRLALPPLEKYAAWLETGRRSTKTVHRLYWQTNLGSGMDNMPRTGSGWVDMSAQVVIMDHAMAGICDVLGKQDAALAYRRHAEEIAGLMNRFMWNAEDGLYYDVDDQGKQIRWKTVACFWPMLAKICSPEQAERLMLHLKDPKSFWRTIPFASFAADQPGYRPDGDYWLGSVWAPTNVALIKGLERNGYEEFATAATEKYLDGLFRVYRKTGTFWENYAPDNVARGSQSKPDFVGWTGCGPIQLLLENVIGVRCDALKKRIDWILKRRDRHGIERLRIGDATVSLLCAPRATFASPATITATTDRPLELVVHHAAGLTTFSLTPGVQTLRVP